MSRQLLETVKDKLSKEDLIDIIVELQEEIDGWEGDYECLKSSKDHLNATLATSEQDRSNAWAQVKQHRERVGVLFDRLTRIAKFINQDSDVISDGQVIDDIVQELENEFKLDGKEGKFIIKERR